MPQFDTFIIFNQSFWFLFYFILFYLFNLFICLPRIFKIIKMRSLKLNNISVCTQELSYVLCNSFQHLSFLNLIFFDYKVVLLRFRKLKF